MIYKIFSPPESKKGGFHKAIDYIFDGEKRGFALKSEAILSFETASAEMSFTARRNPLARRAVYHFTIAWGSTDFPNQGQMMQCVDEAIQELGLCEHQWVAASHTDATHEHIHVVANRVNPISYKCASDAFDFRRLMKLARKQEVQHRWTTTPQPTENKIVSVGKFEISERDLLPAKVSASTARALACDGRMSFQEWLAGEPRSAMLAVMCLRYPNWYLIHDALGEFGIRYEPSAGTASVYDAENREFRGQAGHLGRFATLPKLEKRLGQFKEPLPHTIMKSERSYGKTIALMPPNRYTEDLAREFEADRSIALNAISETQSGRRASQRNREKERRLEILEKRKHAFAVLRKLHLSSELRRLSQAIISFATRKAEDALKLQISGERNDLKKGFATLAKPLRWRAWLNEKFKVGHAGAIDAISDIRGRQSVSRSIPEIFAPAIKYVSPNESLMETANPFKSYKNRQLKEALNSRSLERAQQSKPVDHLQVNRLKLNEGVYAVDYGVEVQDIQLATPIKISPERHPRHSLSLAQLRQPADAELKNLGFLNNDDSFEEPQPTEYAIEKRSLAVPRISGFLL